jgi:hypothetical protein
LQNFLQNQSQAFFGIKKKKENQVITLMQAKPPDNITTMCAFESSSTNQKFKKHIPYCS